MKPGWFPSELSSLRHICLSLSVLQCFDHLVCHILFVIISDWEFVSCAGAQEEPGRKTVLRWGEAGWIFNRPSAQKQVWWHTCTNTGQITQKQVNCELRLSDMASVTSHTQTPLSHVTFYMIGCANELLWLAESLLEWNSNWPRTFVTLNDV